MKRQRALHWSHFKREVEWTHFTLVVAADVAVVVEVAVVHVVEVAVAGEKCNVFHASERTVSLEFFVV